MTYMKKINKKNIWLYANHFSVEINRMKPLLILILLLTPIFAGNEKKKNEQDYEKIKLWEGEIIGVYKGRSKIRVSLKPGEQILAGADLQGIRDMFNRKEISRDEYLLRRTEKIFNEIKKNFLEEKVFPIKQKVTNKKIGSFHANHVELEKTIKKNKPEKIQDTVPSDIDKAEELKISNLTGIKDNSEEFQIMLTGKLELRQDSYYKIISSDYYIAGYASRLTYIDPSAFYQERITSPPKSIIHPKDKKEMMFVEGGLFIYGQGRDTNRDNYNPAFQSPDFSNLIELPSFYIDKYEVTNLEYDKYLRETNNDPPLYWVGGKYPEGKENHPVVSLSFREAEGYAKWAKKRLPTEFEWEKASRGPGVIATLQKDETYKYEVSIKKFPFGNKFDPKIESKFCNTLESKIGDTISIYEIPEKSASPYGVMGMCGNAPEWTDSWYDVYPGHFLKNKNFGKIYKVIRGGAFFEEYKTAITYYRSFGGIPNLREDKKAGFRLVIDYNSN